MLYVAAIVVCCNRMNGRNVGSKKKNCVGHHFLLCYDAVVTEVYVYTKITHYVLLVTHT